jgi:hypothetical protein
MACVHASRWAIAAAPLPVLGPWPALRAGSAWPRFTRILSQVKTDCSTAEILMPLVGRSRVDETGGVVR